MAEVYLLMVEKYWSYEKNDKLNLDPNKLTLGSNRQVWLQCPEAGHEWVSSLVATVRNWAKNKTGCRVCAGMPKRPKNTWRRGGPLIEKFPVEVARFWDFRKNEMNNLDLAVITSGSVKSAWFKCPVDGFEWTMKIWSIGWLWKQGKKYYCPQCRGNNFPLNRSLKTVYPHMVE